MIGACGVASVIGTYFVHAKEGETKIMKALYKGLIVSGVIAAIAEQIREVYRAYLFSAEAHEGQRRRSGEPYIYHPLAVARILAGMHMDHQCLMAAILHDVIEDTETAKDQLIREFGPEVAELVEGTFLEGAPVIRTSAVSSEGLEEVKGALDEMTGECQSDAGAALAPIG